jgi:hypothetical protein
VHARSILGCGLDGRTGQLFERRLTPDHGDIESWIRSLPGPVSVTYEPGPTGVTCWRRMRDWTEAGVWPALHALLLAQLRTAGLLDLQRCAVDASHVHALKGGIMSGPHRSTAAIPAPSTT